MNNMRKHAILDNNVVVEVKSIDEQEYSELILKHQLLVDIEDMFPQPEIGWLLEGSTLIPMEELTEEQREIQSAGKKRVEGLRISNKCIDLIGARNKILVKNTQQIVAVLTALSPIRALLETGALGTARASIMQVSASYTDYTDIFESAIDEINEFEAKYGL